MSERLNNTDRCVLCNEQYPDATDLYGEPVHRNCRDHEAATHQQAMQAAQEEIARLNAELRLARPPYSPVSQAKVDELVRVSWDLRNKLKAETQRAQGFEARVRELEQEIEAGLCKALSDSDCCCDGCLKDAAIEKWNEADARADRLQEEVKTLRERVQMLDDAAQRTIQTLAEALSALMSISHRQQPRKLDDAITWRENDEAVATMCRTALDEARKGGFIA